MSQSVTARPAVAVPATAAFRRLWSAFVCSNLADGLLAVTLPVLVLRRTDSPAVVAGLSATFALPWLVVALPAGVLLDRVDRRLALLAANGVRIAALAVLAALVAADRATVGALYVVAVVLGAAEVVYDTAAQTMLPRVVAAADLERANGRLFAGEVVANRFVGPPVGGLLVGGAVVAAVVVPAAAWAAAMVLLAGLRGRFKAERTAPTSVPRDLVAGVRHLVATPVLRNVTAVAGIVNLALSGALAVLVLYAIGDGSELGLTEAGYGLLLGGLAVGAVGGALGAGRVVGRVGRGPAMTGGIVTIVVLMVTLAVSSSPLAVAGALVVSGFGSSIFSIAAVSLRQQIVPDELQGRVTAGYRLVSWGTAPIGALAAGAVAELADVRVTFWIAASLCGAAAIVTPAATRAVPPADG